MLFRPVSLIIPELNEWELEFKLRTNDCIVKYYKHPWTNMCWEFWNSVEIYQNHVWKQLPHMLPMLPFFTSWAARNSTCGGSTANCPVDSLGWLRNPRCRWGGLSGQIIPMSKKICIDMYYITYKMFTNLSWKYFINVSFLKFAPQHRNPQKRKDVQKALFWTEPTRRCFFAPGNGCGFLRLTCRNVVKDGKTSENI